MNARRSAVALCMVASALAAGCGGSTAVETVVGPDGVRCQTTLAGPSAAVSPNGGTTNVSVTAARDCGWTATSEAAWMQLNATSGQGNATIAVTVARNDVPSTRSGAIVVNNQRVTISQEARPCSYEVRAAPQSMSSDGGAGNITLETLAGCPWTAVSSAPWLRVLTASGTGPATIPFEVAANTGAGREASVTIGDRSLTIGQQAAQSGGGDGGTCGLALTPSVINAPITNGTHSVTVSANRPCDWRATSSAPSWLTVSPASGRGPGTLTLNVARNTGNARSATVTVENQVVTVNQAAMPACTVTIDSNSASFTAQGGNGRIGVTTPEGCDWSASLSPNSSWVRLTNDRGSGPTGEVRYNVSPNMVPSARSATITVGGRTHTINQQAAACSYSLEPPARTFPGTGGELTVTVNTQSGCQWSITSTPNWVTMTGQTSAGFSYTVPPNPTPAPRSGSIVVSGQTHTVTQEAGAAPTCSFSLSANSQNFGAGANSGQFGVTTQAGCSWTATSGAEWVTTTSSGSGPTGTVNFTVTANQGTASRQTTISVGNPTAGTVPFTVTQDGQAPTCTVSVSPTSHNFPAGVGSTNVAINVQGSNCSWTATRSADWVTVTPASGASSQNVSVSVTANPNTSPRQATITVTSGSSTATLNVTQDAAAPTCTYSLSPPSQNFIAGGGNNSFTVNTQPGCSWTAQPAAGQNWVSITSTSATGVSYSVAANQVTSTRSTTIAVTGPSGGATFTVTQDAAVQCSYSVSPQSQNFPHGGGSHTFTVNTQPGCSWTAQAAGGQNWVNITSTSATGVSYSVAPNTVTSTRSTTITVSGASGSATFTITQDAPPATQACTYSISPGSADFGARGGSGTVQVTASSPTCAWTASESVDWITLASTGGTGTAPLNYNVSPHGGDDRREATITVAGHSHRVRQEGDDDDNDNVLASYPLPILYIA